MGSAGSGSDHHLPHGRAGPVSRADQAGAARINRAFRRSLGVVAAAAAGALAVRALLHWTASPAPVAATPVPPPVDAQARDAKARSGMRAAARYTDVTAGSGIAWTRALAAPGGRLLPDALGGGVAILDLDSDGTLDLAFTDACEWEGRPFESPVRQDPGARSGLRIFRGEGGLRYTDVTGPSGAHVALHGTGVAVGDADGDGRDDLLVAGVGGVRLLLNRSSPGSPRLADVTEEWGLSGLGAELEGSWFSSAGFLDADRDGDLDIALARYIRWSPQIDARVDYRLDGIGRAYGPPSGYEGTDLALLRNDGGRLVDASDESGVRVTNPSTGRPAGKALGLAFTDVDGDGDADIIVANDTVANFLLLNDGKGRFSERGAAAGIAYDRHGAATGAMGIDAAWLRSAEGSPAKDDLSVAVGNFANEPDSLFTSRGRTASFSDDAAIEGLAAPTRAVLTFGLVFTDANLDGHVDLVQANGHLEPEVGRFQASQSFAQPAQLFLNTGAASPPALVEALAPEAPAGDLSAPRVGRGLAAADLDGDGDEDLVMSQMAGPPAILRNDQSTGHHWIAIDLMGGPGNPSALGAEIEVRACGRLHRRTVTTTRSYQSAMPATVVVGLGECPSIDGVTIRWPDGTTSAHEGPIPVDRRMAIRR